MFSVGGGIRIVYSGTGQFQLAAAGPVTSNTPAKGGKETGFQLGVCYFFGSGLI